MDPPAAMRRERKVVTALFADLVGSTALTEALDPEDAMEVVGAAVAAMVLAVEELGGTVKDLAGDGVLALFGAPITHENDAERAIRAGLRIVEAVRSTDDRLDVRVGIDTGLVVLGPVGAGSRVEYGATGDTVNVAARLQSAAAPGAVLVGETTRGLAAASFVWGARHELDLKGKAAPVPAWTVIDVDASIAPLRTYEHPLVGRDGELAALQGAVDHALAGSAGLAVLRGGGGLGKTRLLDEARAHGDRRRDFIHWVTLRCLSYETTVPFGPLRHLVEGWLGVDRATDRADAEARARHGVTELFGNADDVEGAALLVLGLPRGPAPAEAPAFQVAEAVEVILQRLLTGAPVVVAVEDVQWADRNTLELIDHLIDRLDDLGALLVLTGRDTPGHPLARWADLAAGGLRERSWLVALDPLDPAAAQAHLTALVGGATLPIDLERALLGRSEGNPYVLEELVRALVDAGALTDTPHGLVHDPSVDFAVPPTLERLVLERLDLLPDGLRRVISVAAVAGRTFVPDVLAVVLDMGDDEVHVALQELARLGLVEPADRRWRFTHAVTQDAAYHALLRKDRRELHRRVAEALAGGAGADLGALARHWLEAGEPALALGPARTAAEAAADAGAADEAVVQFERAVQAAEATEALDAPLLLARALAERRAGRLDDALASFARAGALAAAAGAGDDLAAAAVGYEDTLFATRRPRRAPDPSAELLEGAAAALGDELTARRVRVLAARGRARSYGADREAGRRDARDAVTLARAVGDAGAAAYALLAWRTAELAPDRLAERLPYAAEAVEAADRSGDDEVWIEAARALFVDLLAAGRRDDADALLVDLRARIERRRQPFHLWYLAMWEAMGALLDGDLDRADAATEAFRRQGRRLRYADVDQVYAFQKLLIERERGAAAEVLPLFRRMAAQSGSASSRMAAMVAIVLGEIGDASSGPAFDLVAADRFATLPDDQARGALVALLAETAVRLGRRDDAVVLLDLLTPWAGQALVVGSGAACLGAADHYRGLLAGLLGEGVAAEAHLAAAAALHGRLRAPALAARTAALRTATRMG